MKIIIIVLAVALGLGIIFFCVHKTSDVKTVLAAQDQALGEMKAGLDTLSDGMPALQQSITTTRDSLAEKREKFEALPDNQMARNMVDAYKYTEKDMTACLSELTVAVEILKSSQTIQSILQANEDDLRTMLVGEAANQASTSTLRDQVQGRFKDADEIRDLSGKFTEDLGKFVLQQEQQWLDMSKQVADLKSLSQSDPDLKLEFDAKTKLLELSGEAINDMTKLHSVLEAVATRHEQIANAQKGLLSVVR